MSSLNGSSNWLGPNLEISSSDQEFLVPTYGTKVERHLPNRKRLRQLCVIEWIRREKNTSLPYIPKWLGYPNLCRRGKSSNRFGMKLLKFQPAVLPLRLPHLLAKFLELQILSFSIILVRWLIRPFARDSIPFFSVLCALANLCMSHDTRTKGFAWELSKY